MTHVSPLPCVWTGEAFQPLPRFHAIVAQTYGAGEVVNLAPVEDRSPASHRHFFATVNEAWQNLPEGSEERWPDAEALRKWALIRAGFCDVETFVCANKSEARSLATFARSRDGYELMVVRDAVVTRYRARSQSMKAMGREEFQRSKDGVLRVLSEVLGVAPEALREVQAA